MARSPVQAPPLDLMLGEEPPAIPVDVPVLEPSGEVAPMPEAEAEAPPVTVPSTFEHDGNIYREQSIPLMEQMLAARQQSALLRGAAGVSRGGAQIGAALTRRKPDTSAAQALEREAARPEAEVLQDVQLEQVAERIRMQREAMDPNSRTNRATQDAFLLTPIGKQLGDAYVRGLTRDQIAKFGEMGKLAAELVDRDADNKRGDAQLRETERHNRAMEARPGRFGGMQEGIADRYSATAIGDYDKRVEPIKPVATILTEIDSMQPGLARGVVPPGMASLNQWDKILAALPASVGTQFNEVEKSKLLSAIGLLREYFSRPLTGANLTDTEAARINQILGDRALANPLAQAAAIDLIRKIFAQKARATAAATRVKATPEDWMTYLDYGGLDPNLPVFRDGPAPAPTASPNTATPASAPQGGTVTIEFMDENGKSARKTLPADKAQKYLADPRFKVVQ